MLLFPIFRYTLLFIFSCIELVVLAQKLPTNPEKAWFTEAKVGVFIHWTLDYTPKNNEDYSGITVDVKQEAAKFTAANFQPKEWAKHFKNWGVKYVIITVKGKEGFTLYDSPNSPLSAKNISPAKRDLLKEFTEAMRAEGLKIGFQFSLPNYTIPSYHAVYKEYGNVKVDYMRWLEFTDNLTTELRYLLTNYGKIDILWFDGTEERPDGLWPKDEILKVVQQTQPHVVINNRFKEGFGDYATIKADEPQIDSKNYKWWEFYFPLGFDWKGKGAQENIKPAYELLRMFEDVTKLGGNMLININCDYEGNISEAQKQSLQEFGKWCNENAEAIYGTKTGLPPGLFNGSSTHKGNTLYLIAYENSPNELVIKGLQSEITAITHLKTGKQLTFREAADISHLNKRGWVYFKLPRELEDSIATVLKITFKGDKVIIRAPSGELVEWK
jgi:alpha-L-fucosidase